MLERDIVKVETTRFGTIEVPREKVITMARGMLGFPEVKRYCIIKHKEDSPFFWYQAVDDPSLAFVITNPWLFKPDYHVDVEIAGREMGWDKAGEDVGLEVYVVVTIPKGEPEKMTANLIGPLVLNCASYEAIQIVLPEENYSHKFPLMRKKAA
jgi:flagellar assembly factor FliW